jgi:hypothetical protein
VSCASVLFTHTKEFFYVQFTDPATGKRLSTGKDRRDDVLIGANQLVQALKQTELTTQDALKYRKDFAGKGGKGDC